MIAHGVTEYYEGFDVEVERQENGTYVVNARNEGGYNGVSIDLEELIKWVKTNLPELLN